MNLDDVAQFMKFYLDNLNNIDTETEKFDRDIEGNLKFVILFGGPLCGLKGGLLLADRWPISGE